MTSTLKMVSNQIAKAENNPTSDETLAVFHLRVGALNINDTRGVNNEQLISNV